MSLEGMTIYLLPDRQGVFFMLKHVRKIQVRMAVQELASDFVETKKLQGLGRFGISAIEYTVGKFIEFCGGKLLEGAELRRKVLLFLNDKNKGNAYYNKQLSILGQFFNHCIQLGEMGKNPCKGFKYRPEARRLVDHSEETIKKLLKLPNQKTFPGLRDYVLMLTILDTGIRPYEAQQLRINDIQENTIRVRAEVSKTRTERYLPISKTTLQAIKKLISVRDESWDKNGVLFCGYGGERIHEKTMQQRFQKYSKKLGITITQYHLRHTFALWYIRNGGNAFSLQKIMGHETLEMTKVYVNIAMTDVRNNHATFSPLKNFLDREHVRVMKI